MEVSSTAELIAKVRDKEPIKAQHLAAFISGVSDGSVSDAQIGAFSTALQLSGIAGDLLGEMCSSMLGSGHALEWGTGKLLVATLSTQGVGDKTGLILAPLLAEAGFYVPVISGQGRSDGPTILDKIEAVPGFRTNLDISTYREQLDKLGCFIAEASDKTALAHTESRLHAVRESTSTGSCIPLVAASIMANQIACGTQYLLLEVKYGPGANIKTKGRAAILAKTTIELGKISGIKTHALLVPHSQPIGIAVGTGLEVLEAIECLSGRGPDDLWELVLKLAVATSHVTPYSTPESYFISLLQSGKAMSRFEQMIGAQAGRLDEFLGNRQAANILELTAPQSGTISDINASTVSIAANYAQAERTSTRSEAFSGVRVLARSGDQVRAGELLASVHATSLDRASKALRTLGPAFSYDGPIQTDNSSNIEFMG